MCMHSLTKTSGETEKGLVTKSLLIKLQQDMASLCVGGVPVLGARFERESSSNRTHLRWTDLSACGHMYCTKPMQDDQSTPACGDWPIQGPPKMDQFDGVYVFGLLLCW